MKNLLSVSSAPIAGLGGKEYYDLLGTIEVMKKVLRERVVDGFELQLEPEWDAENAPLTDTERSDWTKTPKFTAEDVAELVESERLPILSVHASRDVGNYLCSDKERDWKRGRKVVFDALSIADMLKVEVCVFHVWDTWKREFNLDRVRSIFLKTVEQFPRIKASVENIPTHLNDCSPFLLVQSFEHVTLDSRWASMYNELGAFESVVSHLANVHLRGSLKKNKWFLDRSRLDFYETLKKIRDAWKYQGLLTVEPEGRIDPLLFKSFLQAMISLKR